MGKPQRGSALTYALLASALVTATGITGYNVYAGITRATAQSQSRTLAGNLLQQALFTLTTEAVDTDNDGVPEAPPQAAGAGPTGGGLIPGTSGAPKSDPWGSALGYCAWDNGSISASAGRIGGDNPGTQSSPVFAVVSAGADRIFQTTCAQARTGVVQGDDGVRVQSVSQVRQGVGGTVYYGDPVECLSSTDPDTAYCASAASRLDLLGAGASKVGEMRVVKRAWALARWDGTTWRYATPKAPVFTENANCDQYGPGAIGTDGNGDLLVCQ